jgi:hypothetical protein
MKRHLFAAIAGCLALPTLGLAQSDGFTIPNAPVHPTARPSKPASLAPAKVASPYNATPIKPIPSEPKPIEYPSQGIPTPLPTNLNTQSKPMTSGSTLGTPQPQSSTSWKPSTNQVILPQPETKEPKGGGGSIPVLGSPTPLSQSKPAPEAAPMREAIPILVEPKVIEPKPSTVTTTTLPPATIPATQAESMVKSPTQACVNGQCSPLTSACADPCVCGPDGRFWIGGEYLYWTARGAQTPPLVSTSPAGTPVNQAGVLGAPGARTLFGGDAINDDWHSGVRVYAGLWLDQRQTFGLDFSGFYLFRDNTDFTATSSGSPIISRPFRNTLNGTQAAELVAFPGILAGTVTVGSGSNVYGVNPNLRINLCCDPCGRLDLLLGYRYMRLSERITVREDLTATDPLGARAPFGTQITVFDSFDTINTFNGGQVGLAGEMRRGNFFVGGRVSVAIGNTHKQVNINGQTRIVAPDGTRTNLVGGLLAQRSNIGTYAFDAFSVIPEVGLNVGMNVSKNVRVYGGYSFLYWTNVTRAAEQIDFGVNPTSIPRSATPTTLQGSPRPIFLHREADYWLHGLNAGIELRF